MARLIKHPRARVPDIRTKYGLTANDIATATGTDVRTVRRWNSQSGDRSSFVDQPIRNLERVIAMLEEIVTSDSIRVWLREPNSLLDYKSPLDVLSEGNLGSVEEAVRALSP